MKATFEQAGRDGLARTGVVRTARGTFDTPCFMPVGTRGADGSSDVLGLVVDRRIETEFVDQPGALLVGPGDADDPTALDLGGLTDHRTGGTSAGRGHTRRDTKSG